MTAKKANDELREENKIVSSKLKELKTSKRELREKHDKVKGIHNELTTSYNLLKEEYTNLKINHDNLVLSHELLFNEPHDAISNVIKIDIATSCDDLIVESIEQGSSSKGKKVVNNSKHPEKEIADRTCQMGGDRTLVRVWSLMIVLAPCSSWLLIGCVRSL